MSVSLPLIVNDAYGEPGMKRLMRDCGWEFL